MRRYPVYKFKPKSTLGLLIFLILLPCIAGCGGKKPLPLEETFSRIEVGRSNATDVLNLLPEKGILHTESSVSIYNKKGFSGEVGIITFNQKYPVVERVVYIQKRSRLVSEKIYLFVQLAVPTELLEQPYETDMRKHAAILRYTQDALINDSRPFLEDQKTESLIGLARTALGVGILELDKRPREAYALTQKQGFQFEHGTLGTCHMALRQNMENVYSIGIRSHTMVDPLTQW